MIQIAEMLRSEPDVMWKLALQSGVRHAVAPLPHDAADGERAWDLGPFQRMHRRFQEAGFQIAAVEASPPMQKIRLGLPGRDEEIESFQTMLRSMGALGIPVVCYNFMAVFGWLRTNTELEGRGGALVTGYDDRAMQAAGLTEYGVVAEDRLWENLAYFLDAVLPVAEQAGVKLAMHPDDPPLSPIRGVGRIMRSVEAFRRLLQLRPSPANGITLCQGNFTLMTPDMPSVIREFGKMDRIFFVHFRDVCGTPEKFVECFHEEGQTDMAACMAAYRDIGYEGVLRPDHVPTLEGDSNANPSYSHTGRLLAIGYITGLREAVYGRA